MEALHMFNPPVWALFIQIIFNVLVMLKIIPSFILVVTIIVLFIVSECYGHEKIDFPSKILRFLYWVLFAITLLTLSLAT